MAGKLYKACGSMPGLLRSPFAGQARSHRIHAWLESCKNLVGACQGCCAAHLRGKPAPTGFMHGWKAVQILWEHARAAAQPICGASPLPQDSCMAEKLYKSCGSVLGLLRSPFAGQARSHRIHAWLESCTNLVGAGLSREWAAQRPQTVSQPEPPAAAQRYRSCPSAPAPAWR